MNFYESIGESKLSWDEAIKEIQELPNQPQEEDELPLKQELIEPTICWFKSLEKKSLHPPSDIYVSVDGTISCEWRHRENTLIHVGIWDKDRAHIAKAVKGEKVTSIFLPLKGE
jgi:hypothetical protein